MKSIFTLITILSIAAIGCNDSNKKSDTKITSDNQVIDRDLTEPSQSDKVLGSYVGNFGTNKITLLITKIGKDSVEGRSVVGGNDRPFMGTFTYKNGWYSMMAKEPGGEEHDGAFEFKIDEKNLDKLEGSWTPNTPTETVTPKTYTLDRRSFSYSTDAGNFPQASKRLLKDEDVNDLLKSELEIMRNEIFARHGYCFKKKDLRDQFEDKDWYIPNTVDVKNDLTEIERKNIVLIKKYEKYADEFGDEFGR